VALIQSKGSLRLAGSISTSVRDVSACGTSILAEAFSDDSTLVVSNCIADSKLELMSDASQQGHELTIFKKNLGRLELIAASGTKIEGESRWNMGFILKSVRLQYHKGQWLILSFL
jgi:hypothetical protein